MARSKQSAEARVVRFFREAPEDVAHAVMGICRDVLRERVGEPLGPPKMGRSKGKKDKETGDVGTP
jgi:hypothetical protein